MPCLLMRDADDPTLFRAEFNGSWTTEEFNAAVEQLHVYVAELGDHPYYAILDATHSAGIPLRGNLLPSIRRLFKTNYGYVALVKPSDFGKKLAQMYMTMAGTTRVGFYQTLAEAEAAIRAAQQVTAPA